MLPSPLVPLPLLAHASSLVIAGISALYKADTDWDMLYLGRCYDDCRDPQKVKQKQKILDALFRCSLLQASQARKGSWVSVKPCTQ